MEIVDIETLKLFFLEASAATYASGKEPESMLSLPGAKEYFYSREIGGHYYEYHDVYFDAGGGRSFGFTVMAVDQVCAWTMNYDGLCRQKIVGDQKVTDTLKKALLEAYSKKLFVAGRALLVL